MLDSEPGKWFAAGSGGLFGIIMFGRYVFRWLGKDKLEFTKDRVETNIVTGQYERIRELEGKNSSLVDQLLTKTEEVGKLKGQVEALTYHSKLQDMEISHLKEKLQTLQEQIEPLMAMLRGKQDNIVELPTRELK